MLNAQTPSATRIRTVSALRARSFAGGTFFRSIDPGRDANNFTVQIVKEGSDGYLIVTNRNLNYHDNVIGPTGMIVKVLDMTGSNWNDLVRIDQLNGASSRIHKYSISCSIAFARQNGQPHTLPAPTTTTAFQLNRLFSMSGKLAVKIEKSAAVFTQSSVISIAPRFKIYKLSPSLNSVGYAIANMRTQVNNAKTWIEMLPRSGGLTSERGGPPPIKFDQQDMGVDMSVTNLFDEVNLTGGDGLPDNLAIVNTGPSRSLILINYVENHDGSLEEANTMYEWVGGNADAVKWKAY